MKAYRYTGGKITKPGAYVDVGIDAYHSGELCDGPSISSTGLRKVLESPAHYWAYSPLNPDRLEDEFDSRAFRLGKAAHCLALEPEKFDFQFAISSFPDFKTAAAREERDKLEHAGIVVLKQDEKDRIDAMAKALRRDDTAISLFRDGLPEMTFACKDEATGVWLLSRPDFVPAHPERGLVDYKTAACAEPEKWSRDAYSHGYNVQAALALHVVEQVTGEKRDTFWFAVQEKDAPYVVQAARLTGDQISFGQTRVRNALDRLARCMETGQWPAYSGPAFEIEPPYNVRKLMEMAA